MGFVENRGKPLHGLSGILFDQGSDIPFDWTYGKQT